MINLDELHELNTDDLHKISQEIRVIIKERIDEEREKAAEQYVGRCFFNKERNEYMRVLSILEGTSIMGYVLSYRLPGGATDNDLNDLYVGNEEVYLGTLDEMKEIDKADFKQLLLDYIESII